MSFKQYNHQVLDALKNGTSLTLDVALFNHKSIHTYIYI